MSGLIFVIRPEPGLSATLRAARMVGLDATGIALSEIRAVPWTPPAPDDVDAILLGSANALRHAGPQLARYTGMPAYVVGEATARAARDAGLAVEMIGEGGLQAVLDRLAGRTCRLLRLAGAEHVALVPPEGVRIMTRVVYENVALGLPEAAAARLGEGAVVLLHSAAAARHFAAECDRLGIARHRIVLAALGPRIADAAGAGWAEVRRADLPRDSALLALVRDMCH